MHPYTAQYPQTYPQPSYPQASAYVGTRPAPGSAVLSLVLTIIVFALALLASPLTILFSIGAVSVVNDPGTADTAAELVGVMIVAFMPLGLPAILGAVLAMYPRISMPREMYPSSGVKTAAAVFLVLHLLTLVVAVIFGVLPQILVL